MRTASFMIMMLITAALSSTLSMNVREAKTGMPRLRAALLTPDEAINGAKKVTTMSHDSDFTSDRGRLEAGQNGINTEDLDNERVTKTCLSAEFCYKKKLICSKICKENNGGVEIEHIPECLFKCKKCIPTC